MLEGLMFKECHNHTGFSRATCIMQSLYPKYNLREENSKACCLCHDDSWPKPPDVINSPDYFAQMLFTSNDTFYD